MKELLKIQQELKSPKSQTNTFGGYKYRNLEDILEAVKPILKEIDCILIIGDEIENIGGYNYIKSTAKLINKDDKEVSNIAYARESVSRKGMDDAQLTGATSSYARKYALNGLFAIDDNKDIDNNEKIEQKKTEQKKVMATKEQIKNIDNLLGQVAPDMNKFFKHYGCKPTEADDATAKRMIRDLEKKCAEEKQEDGGAEKCN